MCHKNVGRADAFVRIGAGIACVALAIIKRKPSMAVLGGMKIASGSTRYCPVYDLADITTVSDEEVMEELGLDFDEDMIYSDELEALAEKDASQSHQIFDIESFADGGLGARRREYIHRAIKRNHYVNRDF